MSYKAKSYGTIKGFSSCSRYLLNKNCITLDLNIGLVRTDLISPGRSFPATAPV